MASTLERKANRTERINRIKNDIRYTLRSRMRDEEINLPEHQVAGIQTAAFSACIVPPRPLRSRLMRIGKIIDSNIPSKGLIGREIQSLRLKDRDTKIKLSRKANIVSNPTLAKAKEVYGGSLAVLMSGQAENSQNQIIYETAAYVVRQNIVAPRVADYLSSDLQTGISILFLRAKRSVRSRRVID